MMSLAFGTFAASFYQNEQAFWMLAAATSSVAFAVATKMHVCEYFRLDRLAYREAMEEIGLILPREFKG